MLTDVAEPVLSPGLVAQVACVLEATARKLGNVHRFADFEDATYLDFVLSAAALRLPLDRARETGVGQAVLESVRATQQVVATNTNLGLVLLLAPMAAIPERFPTREGLLTVLDQLTVDDSRLVYQAIRLARPAGLGQVEDQDVSAEPILPLRALMQMASNRDLVARQYTNGFDDVTRAAEVVRSSLQRGATVEQAIFKAHLDLLQNQPDTLIARKLGGAAATEVHQRVQAAIASREPEALLSLDAWLRTPGHARNPGSTADVVGAAIAWAILQRTIMLPLQPGAFVQARAGEPVEQVPANLWQERANP